MRQRGQTGTEYMLVISVVVVAVVGGSYAFVAPFRDGVNKLGVDVKETLGTGSFRGQGRVNATVHDTATSSNTLAEGGEQEGNNLSIPLPFGGSIELGGLIQQGQLALQRAKGGEPPTGIGKNSCGIWAVSYIMNELGISGTDMQTLMELAQKTSGVLLSCGAEGGGGCTDYSIDQIGMDFLADALGRQVERNPHRGAMGDYSSSKAWLDGKLDGGEHPAVLITDSEGKPHWVVMTGTTTENGVVTGYTYRDGRTGATQTITRGDFQDSWARQGNVAVSFGKPNATASK